MGFRKDVLITIQVILSLLLFSWTCTCSPPSFLLTFSPVSPPASGAVDGVARSHQLCLPDCGVLPPPAGFQEDGLLQARQPASTTSNDQAGRAQPEFSVSQRPFGPCRHGGRLTPFFQLLVYQESLIHHCVSPGPSQWKRQLAFIWACPTKDAGDNTLCLSWSTSIT